MNLLEIRKWTLKVHQVNDFCFYLCSGATSTSHAIGRDHTLLHSFDQSSAWRWLCIALKLTIVFAFILSKLKTTTKWDCICFFQKRYIYKNVMKDNLQDTACCYTQEFIAATVIYQISAQNWDLSIIHLWWIRDCKAPSLAWGVIGSEW